MSRELNTGRPTSTERRPEAGSPLNRRPSATNSSTGIPTVPNRPSGSRTKILISSHVSFQSPRSMAPSVSNRVAGQPEKDILERRKHRSEIGDPDSMLGEALDHVRDEAVAPTSNRDGAVLLADLLDARELSKPLGGRRIVSREDHGPIRTMPRDQAGRRVDIDDPSVVDDRDPVAQALGLLHQVCGQKDRLAARSDTADQLPDCTPRLRVETGRQLVEKHDFRIVDESERDEEPLLLPARQRHEPGVALVCEPELLEQAIAIGHRPSIERGPQVDRLPHFDALLELRFLQLYADSILQPIDIANRIQRQHADRSAVRPSQPFDALHRRGLACAVRAYQSENLLAMDVERHIVHGDEPAVSFADAEDP